jgi:hypothetical protein
MPLLCRGRHLEVLSNVNNALKMRAKKAFVEGYPITLLIYRFKKI